MKKAQKNKARLPRTAGLRTLSEMSKELKKAGLDPSSIEKRAHMLAKVEIARQQLSKRKRSGVDEEGDDDDIEMDYGDEEDWEDEEMDVDEDESVPRKKKRTESGAVAITNKRVPRSNRQLAGLRDADVRRVLSFPWRCDPDASFLQ
jgi:nucleolar GTP-binding protein